ncbi:MAG TPA: tRNA-dihydrouridine synthase [Gemmataceae bacterium]|nr:tRNA-dihydrouridine synthase [Gemmataceae bacterium]
MTARLPVELLVVSPVVDALKFGSLRLSHPIALAPMEEHTNPPFRLLMKQFGASLVCTERIDAQDVAARDRRALRMLLNSSQEGPRAGQISGSAPEVMAKAARVVEECGFNLVDLNFECPIRRLIQRGEGGALLSDPPAIERIVAAVVRSVSIPVTLKIRSGPDHLQETACEVARRAENGGAAAVDVHARSVAQAYVGGPDWSVVARVKEAVRIPVLGSGGVREPGDAIRFLRETGADGVAIGRGCLGNPWIFQQARALHRREPVPGLPGKKERGRVLLQLIEGEFRYYGSSVALRRLARTSCYFAKFTSVFAEFRKAVHQVRDLPGFRQLVSEIFR